jgi:hypothetical protein
MSGLQKNSVRDIGEKDHVKFEREEEDDDIEVGIIDPFNKQESVSKATMTSRTFDRLCLTLGLLMNLVQSARETKDMLRQTSTSKKKNTFIN